MTTPINSPLPLPIRKCLYCGKPLNTAIHGSRRFCPSPTAEQRRLGMKDCKVLYNNKKGKSKRDKIKKISEIQYSNWAGLHSLYEAGQTQVTAEDLRGHRVDINAAITKRMDDSSGTIMLCFIKYGLIKSDRNYFKIVKHEFEF